MNNKDNKTYKTFFPSQAESLNNAIIEYNKYIEEKKELDRQYNILKQELFNKKQEIDELKNKMFFSNFRYYFQEYIKDL